MTSLVLRGQELRAEVAGSQFAPCGLCKHIVAALLAYSHEPESVRELPELEEALSGLEREELKDHLRQSSSYLPMGKRDRRGRRGSIRRPRC